MEEKRLEGLKKDSIYHNSKRSLLMEILKGIRKCLKLLIVRITDYFHLIKKTKELLKE